MNINLVLLKLLTGLSEINQIALIGLEIPESIRYLTNEITVNSFQNISEFFSPENHNHYDLAFLSIDSNQNDPNEIVNIINHNNDKKNSILLMLVRHQSNFVSVYLRRFLGNVPLPNYALRNYNEFDATNFFRNSYKEYYVLDNLEFTRIVSPMSKEIPFWLIINNSSVLNKIKFTFAKSVSKIVKIKKDFWINYKLLLLDKGQNNHVYFRKTGRVVTIQERDDNGVLCKIFRVSECNGGAEREARIINAIAESPVKTYVSVPTSITYDRGMVFVEYPILIGCNLNKNKKNKYSRKIIEFLSIIGKEINPDVLPLEPAFDRLNRYLKYKSKKLSKEITEKLEKDLIKLNQESVFRFLCHGELRTGNIFLDILDNRIIIQDWPQAYIGHPLIDWWMFIYWDKKPKSFSNVMTPYELCFGISEDNLIRLWRVWENLY